MPYRPTERTEARRAQNRERIVAAALEQLRDGGYSSAGVQAIAARAGVATGSVYRHFESKSDLAAEVFRRAAAPELAAVDEATADDGRSARERVATAAETFARRALAGRTQAYALLAEPIDPAVEAERLAFRRGYRDIFARTIEQGIERGELPPQDAQTVAAAIVGALGEALVSGATDEDALVETLVNFCMNALPATRDLVRT
jgi:AcrR family transcriptional regulator